MEYCSKGTTFVHSGPPSPESSCKETRSCDTCLFHGWTAQGRTVQFVGVLFLIFASSRRQNVEYHRHWGVQSLLYDHAVFCSDPCGVVSSRTAYLQYTRFGIQLLGCLWRNLAMLRKVQWEKLGDSWLVYFSIHWFIHSFIHSFIRPFICAYFFATQTRRSSSRRSRASTRSCCGSITTCGAACSRSPQPARRTPRGCSSTWTPRSDFSPLTWTRTRGNKSGAGGVGVGGRGCGGRAVRRTPPGCSSTWTPRSVELTRAGGHDVSSPEGGLDVFYHTRRRGPRGKVFGTLNFCF